MAILVRGGQGAYLTVGTATDVRPQLKEVRKARLTGGSSSYEAACNPVDIKVSEFARVIDIDFSERRLAIVETVEAPTDGYNW